VNHRFQQRQRALRIGMHQRIDGQQLELLIVFGFR
jgi:hypothetical protein